MSKELINNISINDYAKTINLNDPLFTNCDFIRSFYETLNERFLFAFYGLVACQLVKLLLIERITKRYKKGTINKKSMYIMHTYIAIISYLQTVFVFFMISALFYY